MNNSYYIRLSNLTKENSMEITLSDSNYKETIANSEIPVVVDFWAPWCGPCRAIAPSIEELANEYSGRVVVAKCNVDDCPEAAVEYGIMTIPSVLFFSQGKLVDKQVGSARKSVYEDKIKSLL